METLELKNRETEMKNSLDALNNRFKRKEEIINKHEDRANKEQRKKKDWRKINILQKPVKVKVAESCPTLCDPTNYIVHEILQARIQEWVAFPFSRGSSKPGIEPRPPTLQADSLPAEPQGKL